MSDGALGGAKATISLDAKGAIAALKEFGSAADQTMRSVGQSGTQAAGGFASFEKTLSSSNVQAAGGALAGIGAAVGLIGGFAINSAMQFDQGMANVRAATGATGVEFDSLRNLALQIGKDTSFSANEATLAIEELAKAGTSTTDILGGAAEATTALAAAGGVDLPTAATVMSAALNQFGLAAGDASGYVDDMGQSVNNAAHVADVISAAATASATGVTEMGSSLSYVGTSAAALGVPLEDTATAIALMANQGIVGSSAGTSLNQVLLSLANPTAKAAGVMGELGLSFTDLNGNMLPLPDIIGSVATATEGMGTAQRAATLETLFGVEGGRAMNALLPSMSAEVQGTADSWDGMNASVTQVGAAQEQAQARLNSTSGRLEAMKGSLETVGIVIGSKLLPAFDAIILGATSLLNTFLNLPSGIQTVIAAVVGVAGAFAGIAGAAILIGPRLIQVAQGFRVISIAMRAMVVGNPILLAIAAAIGLVLLAVAAYKTNFLGFGDAVRAVGSKIKDLLAPFGRLINLFQNFRTFGMNPVQAALQALKVAFPALGGVITSIQNKVSQVTDMFHNLTAFGMDPVKAAVTALSAAFPRLGETFALVGSFIGNLVSMFQNLWDGIQRLVSGDFSGAFDAFKAAGLDAIQVIWDGIRVLPTLLLNLLTGMNWSDIGSKITDTIRSAFDGLRSGAGDLWSWLTDGIRSALQSISSGIFDWLNNTSASITSGLSAAWDAITSLTWDDFIPDVAWDVFIGAINLATKVGDFLWDTFVTAVDLAVKVGAFAWSAFVTAVDLAKRVGAFAWSTFVTAVDLAAKVGAFAWTTFVTGVNLAVLVGDFAWSTFVTGVSLIGLVKDLIWSDFISGTISVLETIKAFDWTTVVTGTISVLNTIKAFAWPTVVTGSISVIGKIVKFDWMTVISGAVAVADYITSLDWSKIITPIADLAAAILDWMGGVFPPFSWPGVEAIVTAIPWPTLPNLKWPSPGDILGAIAGILPGGNPLATVVKDPLAGWVPPAGGMTPEQTQGAQDAWNNRSHLGGSSGGNKFAGGQTPDFGSLSPSGGGTIAPPKVLPPDFGPATSAATVGQSLIAAIAAQMYGSVVTASGQVVSTFTGLPIATLPPLMAMQAGTSAVFTGMQTGALLQSGLLKTGFTGNVAQMGTAVPVAVQQMGAAVVPHFLAMQAGGIGNALAMNTGVVAHTVAMQGGASGSVAVMAGSVGASMIGMQGGSVASAGGMGTGVLGHFLGMQGGGVASAGALNSGTIGHFGAMKGAGVGHASGLNSGVLGQFGSMKGGGVGHASGLNSGVTGQMGSMKGAGIGHASALTGGVLGQFGSMQGGGVARAGGLNSGVSGQFGAMRGTATGHTSSMAGQVVGIIAGLQGSAGGAARGVGSAIGAGIAGGIQSWVGAIASAAAGAVSAAIGAARAAASIRSPSRVARDKVGVPISQGIAAGIQRAAGLASVAAVTGVSDAIAAAERTASRGPRLAPWSVAGAGASAFGGGVSPLVMSPLATLTGPAAGRSTSYYDHRTYGDVTVVLPPGAAGDPDAVGRAVMDALHRGYGDQNGFNR